MLNKSAALLSALFLILLINQLPLYADDFNSFGKIDTLKIDSKIFNETREILVYLPNDYNQNSSYPVIYSMAKTFYFKVAGLPKLLDSLYTYDYPRAIIVGVETEEEEEIYADSPKGQEFRKFIIIEVFAEVERKYSVQNDKNSRFLLGFSAGATTVCDIAFEYPEYFNRVAAQSPGWMSLNSSGTRTTDFTQASLANLKKNNSGLYPSFWIVWGNDADVTEIGGLWESRSRENGSKIIEAMKEKNIFVETSIVDGTHNLHLYKTTIIPALNFLLK